MLTGVLPRSRPTSAQETMIQAAHRRPDAAGGARPDIVLPPKLQTVLDKALARMPSDRYASAADFGPHARGGVAGLPVPATRVAEQVDHGEDAADGHGDGAQGAKAKAPPASVVGEPLDRSCSADVAVGLERSTPVSIRVKTPARASTMSPSGRRACRPGKLLGAHVLRRAHHQSRLGHLLAALVARHRLRDAEVHHLHDVRAVPALDDHDVVGA